MSLVISTGVAVPNVVGQMQAVATTAIIGAGLTVGTTARAVSTTAPLGSVISESPSSGTTVSLGTAVNLVISSPFTPLAASMTVPRVNHAATLLSNGQVLIAGGNGVNSAFNTAELYDSVANTFTALTATMTTNRAGHSATLLSNGTVIINGGGGPGGNDLDSAELYDPAANTFTAMTATLTTGRTEHAAALLSGGRVLLTGGYVDSSRNAAETAELYTPP